MIVNPVVSIITVTRNAAGVIERTIRSVAEQSYPDIEYIIVDGASADDTLKVVNRYGNHISFIVSEPDKGIYDAMNKGAGLATGDFICFLNAGDGFAERTSLETLFASVADDVEVIGAETNIVTGNGEVSGTRSGLTSRKLPAKLTKNSFLQGQVVSHQAFLVKRTRCIPFNTDYRCSADTDWMIKILSKTDSVHVSGVPLVNYLTDGYSENNLRLCLWERFRIMMHHFNPLLVLVMHVKFAFRFLYYRKYKRRRV